LQEDLIENSSLNHLRHQQIYNYNTVQLMKFYKQWNFNNKHCKCCNFYLKLPGITNCQNGRTILDLMKQQMMGGSGISWTIRKSFIMLDWLF